MSLQFSEKYNSIIQSIRQYTDIDVKAFLEAQQLTAPVSIKINSFKLQNPTLLEFELSKPVQWAKDAYYLSLRPAFYADPLFYAGAYYVMDSSSMFLEYILNAIQLPENAVVLDIAAAPGGKSVILSNYLNENGLLFSNEINYNRAKILNYNLNKWGKCNYIVTNNDSSAFSDIQNTFDLILCDAPCSGSGLFRKYPEWIDSFNEQLVQQCVARQKQILKNIFPSLKENGYLIYSTCSYMSEENEEMAKFILDNGFKLVDISIPDNSGIVKTNLGIRFFPHLTQAEGFFYAVFQKQYNHSADAFNHSNKNHFSYFIKCDAIKNTNDVPFAHFIDFKPYHQIYKFQNKYFLSNLSFKNLMQNLNLKMLSIGTSVSEVNGHQPAPALALSVHLNSNVPKLNLNKTEAQQFLKKEPLKISAEKQLYLMTYQHSGLGWAKVLENRINNYFPSEWRILKEID